MNRVAGIIIIIFVFAVPPARSQERATVEMRDNNTFEPAAITVQVGTTITFENVGDLPHTATARDRSWDTGNVNGGQSAEITFDQPGSFDYVCIYHESLGMIGRVTVEGEAAPAPAEEVSPQAEYLTAGRVEQARPRVSYAPLTFAALGILAALLIAGSSFARSWKSRS